MLLIIDNYDSFTYNLVQYFGELGADVHVYRHDQIGITDIEQLAPDYLVISPGPCAPAQAGISLEAIKHFAGKLPILGVCLGHQSIGQIFGGEVIHAKKPMHGKISTLKNNQKGVFCGLPEQFDVTRYHSLVLNSENLPSCLEVTAWTEDDEIMGIRHRDLPIEGVQFHPESIMTQHGHALLQNFLNMR